MPTSIPQVSTTLQTIFTTTADTAARTTGFIQRQRQLTGQGFVQALVFGYLATPHASLPQLVQSAANVGVTLSPQALDQRFTPAAAACLAAVLAAAVQQIVAAKPVAVPVLQRFAGVYVLDSTTIMLPDSLATVWQGCGGSTPGTAAALKVQVLWNLTTGALHHVGFQDGRASDQRAPVQTELLPAGALRIADLGYFGLDQLADARARGIDVLSRWYPGTAVFDGQGNRRTLMDLLPQDAERQVDRDVTLGVRQRVPVRLLAVLVPQEVVDQRRRRIREEARSKGRAVSAQLLALAAWTICITTVARHRLTLTEALVLLRVRWQIELLFKLWKSHGQVDVSRSQQPWRVLCDVYAKLLSMLVLHWVVLVSCWADPDRSLRKAAHGVQPHAYALARAITQSRAHIAHVLGVLHTCLQVGCRQNPQRKHPNTYQLLLALTDGRVTSCV